MTVEIRPFAPGDSLEALTDLLHAAYAPLAAGGLNFTPADQGVDVTAKRVASGACLVAVDAGVIVGTICIVPPHHHPACAYLARPEVASAHQLGVAPSHQGRGIGTRLLEAAEAWATTHGYAELVLDTAEPARHLVELYRRRGFRHIGHVQWQGKAYRSVLMGKKLAGAS